MDVVGRRLDVGEQPPELVGTRREDLDVAAGQRARQVLRVNRRDEPADDRGGGAVERRGLLGEALVDGQEHV